MKASEIIKGLQKMIDDRGDLDVRLGRSGYPDPSDYYLNITLVDGVEMIVFESGI